MGTDQTECKAGSEFSRSDESDGRCYDRSAVVVGRLTGLAYTMAHEEMRKHVQEVTAKSYAIGAEWLRAVLPRAELPMPASQFVCVLHAMIEGLVLLRLLTPDLIPDRVIRAAFAALGARNTNAQGGVEAAR